MIPYTNITYSLISSVTNIDRKEQAEYYQAVTRSVLSFVFIGEDDIPIIASLAILQIGSSQTYLHNLLTVTGKDIDLKSSPRFHLPEHGSNRFATDYSTGQLLTQKRLNRKTTH